MNILLAYKLNYLTVSGYPSNDTYTNPNDFIQKLSGATNITGAGILLKVMAGDKRNVHAGSWYKLNGATPDQPVSPLPGLITALLNGVPGISGNKILASQLNSGILNPSLTGFLNTRDATGNSSRPAAWLNIIVLDEQLNPVITNDGKNSYYEQVGPGNTSTVKQYNISGREITKNGYVYIYVSNETPNVNVYWDNLQVTQVRSALLQEEGYYPFGLEMKALSTQAATVTTNKYKFNGGTELENSFDVSYYETYFRNYDAQVGRFLGVDPYSESYANMSPYHFAMNNPVSYNDPTGATAYDPNNQHTGITFTGGEYHFERSLWNNDWFEDYGVSMFGGGGQPSGSHYTVDDIINILDYGFGGTWRAGGGFNQFNSSEDANNWSWSYAASQIENGNAIPEIVRYFYEKTWGNSVWQVSFATKMDHGYAVNYILPGFVNNDGSSKIFSYYVENGSILQNFKFLSRLYYEVLSFSDAFWMVNRASPFGRIPDNVSVGISVQNGIPGGNGASISYALNFITHGKDFGFHKTRTILPNTSGLGFGFSLPELSLNYYNGPGSPTLSSFLGSAGTVSFGTTVFGGAYNYSGNSLLSFHQWEGVSTGGGLTLGLIYGNGTTYLGWH